jgi:uncharacterized membrane protein
MADGIDKAHSIITERLKELHEEVRRLEKSLEALGGRVAPRQRTRRAPTSTSKRRASTRQRGRQSPEARQNAILKLVEDAGPEGVRTADIRKRLKVSAPSVARYLNDLEKAKAIKRPKRGVVVNA